MAVKPKKGDRVRIAFEGVFVDPYRVDLPGNRAYYPPEEATIEVLEPEWQSADVVLDADGSLYTRRDVPRIGDRPDLPWIDGGWGLAAVTDDAGDWVGDEEPNRPLTLLVRGGKPVTR